MRWKPKIRPKDKEIRTIKRFAWLPVAMLNEPVVVWLETYIVVEKWCDIYEEWETITKRVNDE